jgi:hypothetical protein
MAFYAVFYEPHIHHEFHHPVRLPLTPLLSK